VKWHEPDVVGLTFRIQAVEPTSELVFRAREAQLEIIAAGRRSGNRGRCALARVWARRVWLAHLFDNVAT
jgi:hypothetical protein